MKFTLVAQIKATSRFSLQQRYSNLLFIHDALKQENTWDSIINEIYLSTDELISTQELQREIELCNKLITIILKS